MTRKTAGVQQGVTAASPCKWSQVMLSVTLYQRWYAAGSVTCHCSVSRQTKHSALREDPTSLFSFLKIYISCFLAGLYYMSYVCCTCTTCTYTMCMPDEFSWATHHKDFSQGPTALTREWLLPLLHPTWMRKAGLPGVSHGREWWKSSAVWLSPLCIYHAFVLIF